MRVEVPGFIVWIKHSWESKGKFSWYAWKPSEDKELIIVRPYEISFDIPDNWDPVPLQIKVMEAEIAKTQAEAQNKVTELKAEINNLLAVGYVRILPDQL